jgi:hypothetical protein
MGNANALPIFFKKTIYYKNMSKYILYKDSSLARPKNVSAANFASASYGTEYTYEPSDQRYSRYYFSSSNDFISDNYRKLECLKNTINYYFGYDNSLNFDNFYNVTSSIIAFNSNYIGSGIQRGTVMLNFYLSGSVIDTAADYKENGVLSSSINGIIGIVLYREGFIIINNSTALSAEQSTFNGVTDFPRWTNFLSNDFANEAFYCDYQFGFENTVPTNILTVTAEKNELNHSNNITYINSGSYWYNTGSNFFKENEKITIKNIVKSPFVSGTANFEKETYISRIGLYDKDKKLIGYASLANPIRKTENREFIFKLKLDI